MMLHQPACPAWRQRSCWHHPQPPQPQRCPPLTLGRSQQTCAAVVARPPSTPTRPSTGCHPRGPTARRHRRRRHCHWRRRRRRQRHWEGRPQCRGRTQAGCQQGRPRRHRAARWSVVGYCRPPVAPRDARQPPFQTGGHPCHWAATAAGRAARCPGCLRQAAGRPSRESPIVPRVGAAVAVAHAWGLRRPPLAAAATVQQGVGVGRENSQPPPMGGWSGQDRQVLRRPASDGVGRQPWRALTEPPHRPWRAPSGQGGAAAALAAGAGTVARGASAPRSR